MRSKARIAVIVPARDAMATLPACLDALMNSSCKPDEIIVFDDGLNLNIGKLAKRGLIKIVANGGKRAGPTSGRNRAARQASADIFAFVDADVVVEKDALSRLIATLGSDPDVAAAFGCYDQAPPGPRLAGLYVNLRHHWIHRQGGLEATTFWTGLGVVRADAFWALEGFDETSRVEDIDFGVRLCTAGKRIRLVPAAQGTHLKNWRLLQLWKTDITQRAYPWSLLIARGTSCNQLNASPRERLSAILAYGFLFSLLGAFARFWLGFEAAVFAGLYIYLNRGLFRLIWRRGGVRGLFAGIALHWFYHIYASAIFVTVQAIVKARAALSSVQRMLTSRDAPHTAIARAPRERPPHG